MTSVKFRIFARRNLETGLLVSESFDEWSVHGTGNGPELVHQR